MTDVNRIPLRPRHPLDINLQHKSVRPGYRIINHPRMHNKPVHCKRGVHGPFTTMNISGVPHLVCTKCGAGIGKGIYEGTWTKQDIHDMKKLLSVEKRTKEQTYEDSWNALEQLRKKFTDKEIRKMMNERLRILEGKRLMGV